MPIITGIDHVILGVHDLDAATATWRDLLGLHVSGGGIHPQFGTINRIIVLDEEYIELLALQPNAQGQSWLSTLLAAGEGCAAFIPAIDDPAAAASAFRQRGMVVEGPSPGRLEAAGGFSRSWQVVRLLDPVVPGVPFVIRHDSSGAERLRLLGGTVGLAPHPLGVQHVAAVTVAVHNLDAAIGLYERCFDLSANDRGEDEMLAANTARLPLPSGAAIILAAPRQSGAGTLAAALATHGEGLFALTLAVDDLANTVRTLRGRGLGVRVDEPEGILVAAQVNQRQIHGVRLGMVTNG